MSEVKFLQVGPSGICFAHGPYKGQNCPEYTLWHVRVPPGEPLGDCPCTADPQKPEYIALANEQARHARVYSQADIEQAVIKERSRIREGVIALRGTLWAYKSHEAMAMILDDVMKAIDQI